MDEKMINFLRQNHIVALTVCSNNEPYSFSAFYSYSSDTNCLVFASDINSAHMQIALKNPLMSGIVALQTKNVAIIRGLQLKGVVKEALESEKEIYLKSYPYARVLKPNYWSFYPNEIKMTDNKLGFGKKILWKRD